MLRRQDEINNILDLYDQIDILEMENERLKNAVPNKFKGGEKKEKSFIDELMLKKGKAQVLNYAISNWYTVDCDYDEEHDSYNFTPYAKWLEKKVSHERMPKTMSFEDFVIYFKNELSEMYIKEKKEALKEAKEDN